jgi:hypothetical protein
MMANLYEILAEAQNGNAMREVGDAYGLSPEETEAAVAALLPAISLGLKRSTATADGLGNLFALVGAQPAFYAMYDDPRAAFSPAGQAAGNAALARMFGSPDASRAIADQAQQLSGISSSILKKLLPIIAGLIISGLMRSGSGKAAPSAPAPAPDQGGGLIDILRQIFGQGGIEPSEPSGRTQSPIPPITDILGPRRDGKGAPIPNEQPAPTSRPSPVPTQPMPVPTDGSGEAGPGGDILAQIMRELAKAIEEGRLKPIVVGPVEIGIPGRTKLGSPGQSQTPGGDILGQILRDLLSGKSGRAQPAGLKNGVGAAVFGDRLESGQDIEQDQLDSLQEVFDRFVGAPR